MNHQPFESWIFEEKMLDQKQKIEFEEHLKSCDSCNTTEKNWQAVRKQFSATAEIPAPSGFNQRWKTNLAARKAEKHQQQVLITLISSGGAVLISFGLLLTWLVLTSSIEQGLINLLSVISRFIQISYGVESFIVRWLSLTPPIVTIAIWIFSFGLIAVLGFVWSFTVLRVSKEGVR